MFWKNADANEKRHWRICADFARVLITRARQLYAKETFGVELKQTADALDSTTIDLGGSIPCFIRITSGRVGDVSVIDHLPIESGAFYIMDRGYPDFARLYRFSKSLAFFVTLAK